MSCDAETAPGQDARSAEGILRPVSSPSLHALLARAGSALERGRGPEAVQVLAPILRAGVLAREDDLAVRSALAEAWLLQDDVDQAAAVLGRTPDTFRDAIAAARLAALWRLHGRIASVRGDQSRAIAHHGRALKYAESAHDSRAIGLAHYELALCYRQVGDTAIVREHLTRASSALHAAGDRRHLALVHSLSSIALAQAGRLREAMAALRQAERLATKVQADDVVATVVGNQANVLTIEHRYEQALTLAERSVALHESHGSGHGLAVALATMGQICVRLGDLSRAQEALHRALAVRSPIQFHETVGAVHDTLAQIYLIWGSYDAARESLEAARESYGAYGRQTSHWYDWSVRVLLARLALRRGAVAEAVAIADETIAAGAPTFYALQSTIIAAEALATDGDLEAADARLALAGEQVDPPTAPATWAEYLRLRGTLHEHHGRPSEAYHDYAQSATLLELLGERYLAALSHLAIGRLVARTGAASAARLHLDAAAAVFERLKATRDIADTEAARRLLTHIGTGENIVAQPEADDALVRRMVDAAELPELLDRETVATLLEASSGSAVIVYTNTEAGVRIIEARGCDEESARRYAREALEGRLARQPDVFVDTLGRGPQGPRGVVVAAPQPIGYPATRRLRMLTAVARQGFALCSARERSSAPPGPSADPSLEPLLPGFLSASAAMNRVVDQIQRLQGNDLTVLITGESGTGKELVARAIHAGSHRSGALFLAYNCTTTGRDLADSQLFGHRRGAFTGAVSDHPGVIRSAVGGSLFLDEIGDVPLDVQPKLLRFLEQSEIMPVGDSRPIKVDVRVIAATNADLEQRVAEGRFREDLYYRLSVIRIHVPPLRERREEIPHLATLFLREAAERLAKPDVSLGSDVLDLFAQYWWPGNVRQLKNEIQRLVAMSTPGRAIDATHLSPELLATRIPETGPASHGMPAAARRTRVAGQTLAAAVEQVERDFIQEALTHAAGNISEAARTLGLTRRGLYLKLRRLGLDTRAEAEVG
jgi:DNA-binding NtrC family response regulator/tetratricopeptide (TPR) repeat protein